MKIDVKTKKFVISVILAFLSIGLCYVYGSAKAGAVFAILFLIVGSISLKKKIVEGSVLKALYLTMLFAIFSLITVFICQRVLNEGIISLGLWPIILNMCICIALFVLLFCITLNAQVSVLLVSGLLVLFTTANYYVFLFRGTELNPADILAIGTAANVAVEYKIVPNGPIVYAWLLLFICWCILFTLPAVKIEKKASARVKAVIVIAACIGVIIVKSKDIQILHYMQGGSVTNGYLLNFALQIQETIIRKPEGYDAENILKQETRYVEKKVHEEELPDIFVVMDESFADLSILGSELRTNTEVAPFISSMNENTIKGYALASVFGGGTPNSEYEFLSGNSMFFLPRGAIVYQQYIKNNVYSMISDFKDMDYYCVAMHPFLSDGWARDKIYPLLNYDESYFLEEYPQDNMIRDFVSDQEAFEVLIKNYESFKKTSDRNTFMFLVTMQNHGAYTYEGADYKQTIDLEGYDNEYPDAEQYLSLIHETDAAVKWLVDYLQTVDHDAVLVFYGDHLPGLDDRFYQEIHGGDFETLDEQNLKQTVPFFIWANYDIEEEYVDLTSFNFMSNYMYKAAGIELPAYNQFLAHVEGTIPAMNAMGYYSVQDGCFKTYEEAEGKEASILNEYSQFVYNCMFDTKNRNDYFFPVQEQP